MPAAVSTPLVTETLASELPHLRMGPARIPMVLPRRHDPRLHLSIVTITLFVIGIGWLDFRLSIPQILAAMSTSAIIEIPLAYRRTSMLVWPASGLQTASSVALLLRVTGTTSGDIWSFRGWYYFAGVTALGLATKHLIRRRGGHVFNPSNIALVLAFLALGSARIEPLDLWWGPLDVPMVAAYAVIIVGGLAISRRLDLVQMGVAFWATLAVGVAALAAVDHSITTQWSLTPITGAHFWWIVMTSPEILIYLFFMLTDPRTVPRGRTGRIVFGVLVGAVAAVMIAPWGTEFGTKVGLLAALVVVSATRPLLDRVLPEMGSTLDDPRRFVGQMLHPVHVAGPRQSAVRIAVAVLGVSAFAALVAGASLPSRTATDAVIATDIDVPPIDPASLPPISIDDNLGNFDSMLATEDGARGLVSTLAWNLAVEAEALRTRDPGLLEAIDHGYRLGEMQRIVHAARSDRTVSVPVYEFDSLRLMIAYPGGAQAGANAGVVAHGTVTDVVYGPAGEELSRERRSFATTFTLRPSGTGTWQITDTLPVPRS